MRRDQRTVHRGTEGERRRNLIRQASLVGLDGEAA